MYISMLKNWVSKHMYDPIIHKKYANTRSSQREL